MPGLWRNRRRTRRPALTHPESGNLESHRGLVDALDEPAPRDGVWGRGDSRPVGTANYDLVRGICLKYNPDELKCRVANMVRARKSQVYLLFGRIYNCLSTRFPCESGRWTRLRVILLLQLNVPAPSEPLPRRFYGSAGRGQGGDRVPGVRTESRRAPTVARR